MAATRAWMREWKVVLMVVMIFALADQPPRVAAESDLSVLKDVRDALDHSDQSLHDLKDLVTGVINSTDQSTTRKPPATTAPPTTPPPARQGMEEEFLGENMTSSSAAPDPWWQRVNMELLVMGNLIAEIGDRHADKSHAEQLEEEAQAMDELVDEGYEDSSVVTEGELDYDLYQFVEDSLRNSSDYVETLINKAEADNVEMIVTIVMMSLLFVVVLTGLTFALIRPWAKSSSVKPKHTKKAEGTVAKDESFPDAKFVQHLHIHMDPYRNRDTKI